MAGPSTPWGVLNLTVCLGDEQVTQRCTVLDTEASDIVIGTDILHRNPKVKLLLLQCPYAPQCDLGSSLSFVHLEWSGRQTCGLSYVNRSFRTGNYKLVRTVVKNGLAAL